MTHMKYRIPRVTKAALLLGGAACGGGDGGDNPGGSTAGIDVSSSRIHAVAKAYCEQYQECYSDDFDDAYDSQADCIEAMEDGFDDDADNKCADAALDYVSCYSKLSCSELEDVEEECGELFEAYSDACGEVPDRANSASSAKRVKGAKGVLRKYRIPR